MPRQARRYDIYLPLQYNDGTEIENEKFVQVQKEILRQFGGLTSMKREFPLRGLWENETRVYEDEVIILTTIDSSDKPEESEQFIIEYKETLKVLFEQKEIFITGQDLTIY